MVIDKVDLLTNEWGIISQAVNLETKNEIKEIRVWFTHNNVGYVMYFEPRKVGDEICPPSPKSG